MYITGYNFTKEDVSTSYEQVESLTREYNIHYRACIGYLIYLFSTRVELSFAVHKLAQFSSNPGKVHFEGLVHLLRSVTTRAPYLRKCHQLVLGLNIGLSQDISNWCII